jgi:hypothetical protein
MTFILPLLVVLTSVSRNSKWLTSILGLQNVNDYCHQPKSLVGYGHVQGAIVHCSPCVCVHRGPGDRGEAKYLLALVLLSPFNLTR